MSRFFPAQSDSDSEPDSSEDDIVEQESNKIKKIIKKNRDAKNNNDLKKLLNGFDTLVKTFESSKEVFQQQNVTFPRFYIRSLVEVEDHVNSLWENEDVKAALSKINAAALPVIRQKMKKYVKKEKLDTLFADYRANPDEEGYETPEDDSSDDDSDEIPEAKNDSDDEDLSGHSSSSWSSDTSSSGEEDTGERRKKEKLRRCFLKEEKKTSVPSSSKS